MNKTTPPIYGSRSWLLGVIVLAFVIIGAVIPGLITNGLGQAWMCVGALAGLAIGVAIALRVPDKIVYTKKELKYRDEVEPEGLQHLIHEYISTRETDLSDQSKWISDFQKFGEKALPFLEKAIADNWHSHPRECSDLLYAIGWIGGERAIEILASLKESKLTNGTLLTPNYYEHELFVPTALKIYQHLCSS